MAAERRFCRTPYVASLSRPGTYSVYKYFLWGQANPLATLKNARRSGATEISGM